MKKTSNIDQLNLLEVEKQLPQKREKPIDFSFELADALSAPILTFSSSWADTIPQRLMNLVPVARMINLTQSIRQATYVEGVIYIYTRTLEAPMDSDWVDIYTHISCATMQKWFGEDTWKTVNAPKKLSEWHHHKLNHLLQHIYDKRRDILRNQLKASGNLSKNPTRNPGKEKNSNKLSLQQSLFDF